MGLASARFRRRTFEASPSGGYDGHELFGNYRAMAVANGVDRSDPVLTPLAANPGATLKKSAFIACVLAANALVACSSKPEPHPEFGAFGDPVVSTIRWKEGEKYEHYAYGGFAGNLLLQSVSTSPNEATVYEFNVVESAPQKMPLGFTFKLNVPKQLGGLHPAEHLVTCESCQVGSAQTLLAPMYVVLQQVKQP